MLTIALLLQATVPAAEAEALGVTLAKQGSIVALLPMIGAKETEEMVSAHPALSAAEQATLRRIAAAMLAKNTDRLTAAIGHRYARMLTVAEMRSIVAFNATPAASRYRAVQPTVIGGAMATVGNIDFKGDTLKAFCAEIGKACPKK